MSTITATGTASRTRVRRVVTGRPTTVDLVDAGFLVVLGLIAMWGFRSTFDSSRFLVVGAIGLILGVAVAHIANTLQQRWFVLALMVVVTFFLFGGAVALSQEAIGGVLPNGPLLGRLADLTISGWKDLLTTLPPVDGTGQFLVLPYLLGLACGAATFSWARRSQHAAWPVVLPVLLLVVVILLGPLQPAGLLLHGLGFSLVAFTWVTVRRRRTLRIVGTGTELRHQAALAVVLLAGSLGIGAVTGGHLPGTDGPRTVLRSFVLPPFDITQFPSPLVGFRKYTEGAKVVWDQELFTVSDAAAGSLVRLSVLDDYAGTVWNAGGASSTGGTAFRRVGSTIAPPDNDPESAEQVRAVVTIGAAYAGLADANAWVPSLGYPHSLVFGGDRAKILADSIRYNPGTGQALVAARLSAGDTITLLVSPVPIVGDSFVAGSGSSMPADATQSVSAKAVKWADKKAPGWPQLAAVADTLRNGAYSDGTKSGETQYLPGHSLSRLSTFLTRPQLVGNDEQYAATFALMANSLGVPARVVMGAVLPADGRVRGQDVHAWVEVRSADGRWYAVPSARFVPDRNKSPQQQPQAVADDANAADVPPPNSQRPPGSVDATFDTTPAVVRPPTLLERIAALPPWVLLALQIAAYPLIALAVIVGGLALARALRRRRRQGTGSPSRRLASGWRDYVDHARDLGVAVPAGLTRREEVALVGRADLAQRADAAVFGWGDPDPEAIAAYWTDVRSARAELTCAASRRRQLLRRISLRGLLFRDQRLIERSTTGGDQLRIPRVLAIRRAT